MKNRLITLLAIAALASLAACGGYADDECCTAETAAVPQQPPPLPLLDPPLQVPQPASWK